MTAPLSPTPPTPLEAALDRLAARVRRLWLLGGVARLVTLTAVALVVLFAADRLLDLPRGVRALVMLVVAGALLRDALRRVVRPVARGVDRLDAARIVEGRRPEFAGRLVSTLQLGAGAPGTLERRVADEAARLVEETDLDEVTSGRPAAKEGRVAFATAAVVVLGALLLDPPLDVFARRMLLADVAWPRATTLSLTLPERGPGHLIEPDGTVVVVRGGVLDAEVGVTGTDPGRVDLVVVGERGERSVAMGTRDRGGYGGHVEIEAGDVALFARGGDDPGDDVRLDLTVVEPPRLADPRFVLEPPAYTGEPARTVGPAGLVVPEGTRVTATGVPTAPAARAELVFADGGERLPLELDESADPPRLTGTFVAEASDALHFVLAGERGLQTQDPAHHALVVRPDAPPSVRVFLPSRSDVKLTANAVVLFALAAEDDHGVTDVALALEPLDDATSTPPIGFARDPVADTTYRLALDLADASTPDAGGSIPYAIVVADGRDLPGRGPQRVRVEGRRLDLVEEAEVQRLLADRQLRIKDGFEGIRERQGQVADDVADLALDLPDVDRSDLAAAAVAQNQVTARLERQTRDLCAVVDETILNRLDGGPGARAVLERRLLAFLERPVDRPWHPGTWRELAADHEAGRYGRLDVLGRLLDMAALALDLHETLSPAAHAALVDARAEPTEARLAAAADAQALVLAALDRLLQRMDEWEDYQEVLSLVRILTDDQKNLRTRTHDLLSSERSDQ